MMANESRWAAVLTDAGAALLAGAPGNALRITKAQCGSGFVDEGALAAQTAVSGAVKALSVTEISSIKNVSKIRLQLSNGGVASAFELRQIGIFATLGSGSGDVLYMILQNSEPDLIPSAAQSPNYVYDCLVNLIIGNAENVTAELDTAAFATVAHTHSAGDITTGILPVERGGLGTSDTRTAYTSLRNAGQLSIYDDLNDEKFYLYSGVYHSVGYSNADLHYPVRNASGFLEVTGKIHHYAMQKYYVTSFDEIGDIYMRRYRLGDWSDWVKITTAI